MERARSRERSAKWEAGLSFGKTAVRTLGWVAVAYCFQESVSSLAGKSTSAIISTIFSFQADRWIAYSVAALASIGYVVERRSKTKTVKQLGSHIKELELLIDPDRSSSRLLSTGEASKEDLDGA